MLTRILVLSAAIAGLWQEPQPREDDFEWVERHIASARDTVMPMDTPEQVAAYRLTGDRWVDRKEAYFSISRVRIGRPPAEVDTYVATVTSPAGNVLNGTVFGGTLRTQLMELHHADVGAPLEILLLKLSIRRTRLTVEQCPAITARMHALDSVTMTPPRADRRMIYLHPPAHQVIATVEGARVNTSFQDAETSLAQWALQTLDDLNKCVNPS